MLTPLQGAALAHNAGLRVFTVALGTKNGTLGGLGGGYGGGLGPLGGQGRFPVRPDPVTLAAIARATDGQTFQARSASKVQNIYKELGASIARARRRVRSPPGSPGSQRSSSSPRSAPPGSPASESLELG